MVPFHPLSALRPCADVRPRPRSLAALTLAALTVLAAQAQPAARSLRPDPLDPQVSVPPLRYQSSLQPEGRAAAAPPIAWREANDAVARIGGWRVYAREAQQPDPAPAAPPVMPPAAPPSGQPAQPGQPDHRGHQRP